MITLSRNKVMDTLFNDLIDLLSNYFDVLATVFLTGKQLELEDADISGVAIPFSDHRIVYKYQESYPNINASVYSRQNWPWILTNLKFGFIPIEACIRDGDKHRILEFLNNVIDPEDPSKSYVGHVYQHAHKYNQKKLIERYSKAKDNNIDNTLAIFNAIHGGHTDLFLEHIDRISGDQFLIEAVFGSGKLEIIKAFNLGPHNVDIWIFGALKETIENNHLDLLKDLIEKYPERANSELLSTIVFEMLSVDAKTFDTLVWLFESKLINITTHYDLNIFLEDMIRSNCQTRLFQYVVNRFSSLINGNTIYSTIVYALEYNRIDCALCFQTATHCKAVWMDEATIFNSLREDDRNKIKQALINKGARKLYNKLI